MKRILSWALALVFAAGFVLPASLGASALRSADRAWEYTLNGNNAVVTKYWGSVGDVDIPSVIDGHPVTEIGNNGSSVFGSNVYSVTVPDSVTKIGVYGFRNSYWLTNVDIPNSVTDIGGWSFSGCVNLAGVTIPGSVNTMGAWAFKGCRALIRATLGNGIAMIPEGAFSDCESLVEVSIPDSVTRINGAAFNGCSSLLSLYIPSNVQEFSSQYYTGKTVLTDSIFRGTAPGFSIVGVQDSFAHKYAVEWGHNFIPVGTTRSELTLFAPADTQKPEIVVSGMGIAPGSMVDIYVDGNWAGTAVVNESYGFIANITLPAEGEYEIKAETDSGGNSYSASKTVKYLAAPIVDDGAYSYMVENGKAIITGYNGIPTHLTLPGRLGGYPVTAVGYGAFGGRNSLVSVVFPGYIERITTLAMYACASLDSVTILNSTADIGNFSFGKNAPGFTIYGFPGSTAHAYASYNGHNFVALTSPAPVMVTASGAAIDLATETISLGDAAPPVAAYSVNGGKTWKKGALPTDPAKVSKLFNKDLTLWVATELDARNKPAGEFIKFPKINARPKANPEKLKPWYGEETWELRTKTGGAAAETYEWAPTTDKKNPSGPWQALPDGGFAVQSGKTKTTYLFRTPAVSDGDTYIPAGKVFKVTPANFGKKPNYTVRNGILKLKANDWYQLGGADPETVKAAASLDMLYVKGPVTVWKGATGKKPRTEKAEIIIT